MHVAILLFWGQQVVGLSDLTFNQESAEAATWTRLKENAVPIMGKWLGLLVIQQILY